MPYHIAYFVQQFNIMETRKNVTTPKEFNIATVKPEFKKQNGENVRIMDLSDNELTDAIDFMTALIARKEKELSKLFQVSKYLTLEYELREGSHIITPCVKGNNMYVKTQADINNY